MGVLDRLKSGFIEKVDPDAKAEAKERDIMNTKSKIVQKRREIKAERDYRAKVRSGAEKGGFGSYMGSVVREKRKRADIEKAYDKLDPKRKVIRKEARERKRVQRVTKIRKTFHKIDDTMDQIRSGFEQFQDMAGGKQKGKGNDMGDFFGGGAQSMTLSDKDLRAMAGMGGSKKKGKKNGDWFNIDI